MGKKAETANAIDIVRASETISKTEEIAIEAIKNASERYDKDEIDEETLVYECVMNAGILSRLGKLRKAIHGISDL